MTTETNKPATSFWVVSVLALLWNLMGAMAYLAQVMMTPETLQAMPENQRALYTSTPQWATAAFAFGVWGGTLACVLLLLRKKLSTTVFMISFAGIIVQMTYNLFMSNMMDVVGASGLVLPIMILAIGAFLIWYSRNVTAKGWIS